MNEEPGEPADTALLELLKRDIEASGPIPVARYMRTCLTHPCYGYYSYADAVGASGDFVTAPEISQIFGELIGIWVAATWAQIGKPRSLRLVELGPGRGTMMRDCLRAVRVIPGLREKMHVVLVEINERLRAVQEATLEAEKTQLSWLSDFSVLARSYEPCPTIILANEFFDALPVTQFVCTGERWQERAVGLNESGHLAFTRVASDETLPHGDNCRDGDIGDIVETRRPVFCDGSPSMQDIFASLTAAHPTVLLAIDYGYDGPVTGDTFQAMRSHTYADVLENPGMQDLTAHVDFTELKSLLHSAGYAVDGPIPQTDFLTGMGFSVRLSRLLAGKDARQTNTIETAAHRLIADPGMGSLFRFMAARSPQISSLPPFPSSNT